MHQRIRVPTKLCRSHLVLSAFLAWATNLRSMMVRRRCRTKPVAINAARPWLGSHPSAPAWWTSSGDETSLPPSSSSSLQGQLSSEDGSLPPLLLSGCAVRSRNFGSKERKMRNWIAVWNIKRCTGYTLKQITAVNCGSMIDGLEVKKLLSLNT